MPKCSYPLGCEEYAQPKSDRCSTHQVAKGGEKAESEMVRRIKLDQEAARLRAAEQDARNKTAEFKRAQQEQLATMRREVIASHRRAWNILVDAIVSQVVALRLLDPKANAGSNAVGDTLGGNENPLTLTTSGAMHGVTKADIIRGMTGLDSSDSGIFKFRRSLVLVHCQ